LFHTNEYNTTKMGTTRGFKFWKENRIDQEFDLSIEQVREKYKTWLSTKERDWIEACSDDTVNCFVGDEDGLNSVPNGNTYDELIDLLRLTRREFLNNK